MDADFYSASISYIFSSIMNLIRIVLISTFVSILTSVALGQGTGSIGGSVTDTLGAVVPGATVTAVAADGTQKTGTANKNGEYSITGLVPGTYTVRASSGTKFAPYENAEVAVRPVSGRI